MFGWFGRKEGPKGNPPSEGMRPMSTSFKRGVQYNMKIILRGDVNVGKSSLFRRLQGQSFEVEYVSTPEIQVANIPWSHRGSNDIIKLEIWDIVDKALNCSQPRAASGGIKLEHTTRPTQTSSPATKPHTPTQTIDPSTPSSQHVPLDASTVDVYRNTHGVIFLFDLEKAWTWEYIDRELESVPETVSVLVLANFRDRSRSPKIPSKIFQRLHHHSSRRLEVLKESIDQPRSYMQGPSQALKTYPTAEVRLVSCSMLSGYGLQFVHRWLSLPFLELQIASLQQQLGQRYMEEHALAMELESAEEVPEEEEDTSIIPTEDHHEAMVKQESLAAFAPNTDDDVAFWGGEPPQSDMFDVSSENMALSDPHAHTKHFNRESAPSPPSKPSQTPQTLEDTSKIPLDEFVAGEGIGEDFFSMDATTDNPTIPVQYARMDSENEPTFANPMVTADEDVESSSNIWSPGTFCSKQLHDDPHDGKVSDPVTTAALPSGSGERFRSTSIGYQDVWRSDIERSSSFQRPSLTTTVNASSGFQAALPSPYSSTFAWASTPYASARDKPASGFWDSDEDGQAARTSGLDMESGDEVDPAYPKHHHKGDDAHRHGYDDLVQSTHSLAMNEAPTDVQLNGADLGYEELGEGNERKIESPYLNPWGLTTAGTPSEPQGLSHDSPKAPKKDKKKRKKKKPSEADNGATEPKKRTKKTTST
ncbi:hypothetical protein BZG36_01317 [Bifiguratus adelaidae]|uniref:Uncharacterized protein n=1 Tax=Bifiguratus adelaidae TaxID=1938954 RepID=A0A261Y559_9FUNG|nr:hypothetical protein BZG36_01317 [Bifiguratus adelaidae]